MEKCGWLFYTKTKKIFHWIGLQISAKSRVRVTVHTIAVFPPEAIKGVGNFASIVLFTFYTLPEKGQQFPKFSTLALRCITCYVIPRSILLSAIALDQWASEKSLSHVINKFVTGIDLYSFICLLSYFRPRDCTLQNCFFQNQTCILVKMNDFQIHRKDKFPQGMIWNGQFTY